MMPLNTSPALDPLFGIMMRQCPKELAKFYRALPEEDKRTVYEMVETLAKFFGEAFPKLRKPKPRKLARVSQRFAKKLISHQNKKER